MGCGGSKQSAEGHELPVRTQGTRRGQRREGIATVSAPQGGLQLVPAPERDTTGRPILYQEYNLSRRNLKRALHYVADFINRRENELTLIAVGGAVNTIHLQSREATHDVDFFTANLSYRASAADVVRAAAVDAAARSSVPLGGNWLNNATALFLGREMQKKLRQEAIKQDCVIFQEPGLKVLAAPWHYALCGKLDRMCKPEKCPYDAADAARYLHQHITTHGNRMVPVSQIQQWAAHFKTQCSIDGMRDVNDQLRAIFGKDGIAF